VLHEYDATRRIQWRWQALDGAMTKAPLGGEQTGKNPTDRAKCGTKRSLLTDGRGTPIGICVSGANTHDKRLVEDTINSTPIERPWPPDSGPQHLCLDKGYDYQDVRLLVAEYGYTAHIPRRGVPISQHRSKRRRARRWVVERSHSWLNRFRRLLIRWEKKVENYASLLYLACAHIGLRAARVSG
jgi:putative transposase